MLCVDDFYSSGGAGAAVAVPERYGLMENKDAGKCMLLDQRRIRERSTETIVRRGGRISPIVVV